MRTVLAWIPVAVLGVWAVVRLLGLERGFPLVPLLAFTPVAVVGGVLIAAFAALLRRRAAAVTAAVLVAALAVAVAPRAMGGPTGAEGPTLRVLTANMRFGRGSADALVALVRRTRADVLSVQELTPELVASLDAAGLAELLPARELKARRGGSGVGVFARVPLRSRPAPAGTFHEVVVAAVQVDGAPPVDVVAVHPPPPIRPDRIRAWHADLSALPAAASRGPLRILAGDFNATLDHAKLRDLLDTGYEDAADAVGRGLTGTWPQGRRLPPPITIDHVLADRRTGVRTVSVHTIPRTDHRAVFAELVLPRGQTSSAGSSSSLSSARIP